jgi:hypothetical protein
VQPAGAMYSLVPALAQVGLVRAEQAGPDRRVPPTADRRSRRWRSGERSCALAVGCG